MDLVEKIAAAYLANKPKTHSAAPVATIEEAKAQAEAFIRSHRS